MEDLSYEPARFGKAMTSPDEARGKLVKIQHGPATVIGDESRTYGHCPSPDGKAAASRMTRESGYQKGAGARQG